MDDNAIDSNGSSGPALTDYITSLTGGAAGILSALRPAARPAAAAPAPAAGKTNYTPWIIGGGILAAVLFVLVLFRK